MSAGASAARPPVVPADLYGVEYLLRLLVRLPRLAWAAGADEGTRATILDAVRALCQFINERSLESSRAMFSSYERADSS